MMRRVEVKVEGQEITAPPEQPKAQIIDLLPVNSPLGKVRINLVNSWGEVPSRRHF